MSVLFALVVVVVALIGLGIGWALETFHGDVLDEAAHRWLE